MLLLGLYSSNNSDFALWSDWINISQTECVQNYSNIWIHISIKIVGLNHEQNSRTLNRWTNVKGIGLIFFSIIYFWVIYFIWTFHPIININLMTVQLNNPVSSFIHSSKHLSRFCYGQELSYYSSKEQLFKCYLSNFKITQAFYSSSLPLHLLFEHVIVHCPLGSLPDDG